MVNAVRDILRSAAPGGLPLGSALDLAEVEAKYQLVAARLDINEPDVLAVYKAYRLVPGTRQNGCNKGCIKGCSLTVFPHATVYCGGTTVLCSFCLTPHRTQRPCDLTCELMT